MLLHYIKFALRNFKSNKVIFIGSLTTICLGALCISLLFSYVDNELSMDKFHERHQDIYMVVNQASPASKKRGIGASSFFNIDYKKYPEIENVVRLAKYPKGGIKFTHEEKTFNPEGFVTDSSFLKIFDFKLILGDEDEVLANSEAIILTQSFAKKMFGDKDPIDKKIRVNTRGEKTFYVKGIIEDLPTNSSMIFDFIIPYTNKNYILFSRSGAEMLLMNKQFDRSVFDEKIKDVGHEHQQFKESITSIVPFSSLPYSKNNIGTRFIISRFINKTNLYSLLVIIGGIFVITLLNLANLQIINTNSSLKQSALNKVNGAKSKHVVYQHIINGVLLLIFSLVVTCSLFPILLPGFNNFTKINLHFSIIEIMFIQGLVISLIIILSLCYPIYVSLKTNVISGLKKNLQFKNKLIGRKGILVGQFLLTFILLISAVTVVKQLQLMLNKDLGFKHENIVLTNITQELTFPPMGRDLPKDQIAAYEKKKKIHKNKRNQILDELGSHPTIKSFAQGSSPIEPYEMPWKKTGSTDDYTTVQTLSHTSAYIDVLGLKLTEGRFFEKNRDKQRGYQIVINEAAKKFWGITDISKDRILNKYWSDDGEGYEIIGVVKDFNFQHLSNVPQPLVMLFFENVSDTFLIEFEEGETQNGLALVEKMFKEVNPYEGFSYHFLNDDIAALYQKEKRLSTIYILFTSIALFISAIGLFTIALYDTQRRTKEIGVRKVNGASSIEIVMMLNKDFIKWVGIAFVLACPIAYYLMYNWLENFAYKTAISWWIFVLAGVFTLILALLTVSWQSYSAATRNPVETLRDE